jgi:two-component system, LuxR family, sensor kinase FixL
LRAAALAAAAYYIGAKVGLALTFQPLPVSILWPPNAILMAALLLARTRAWPALIAGAFGAHLAAELGSGVPVPLALAWFASNTAEALIGAGALRRWLGDRIDLDRSAQFWAYLAFGAFLAPFLSSFLDAAFVRAFDRAALPYGDVWRARFLSNVLAALTVAPAVLTWAPSTSRERSPLPTPPRLETAAGVGSLVVLCAVVFGGVAPAASGAALLYAPLPCLLWAALRHGARGVSACLLLVTMLAIWSAGHGFGPFAARSAGESAIAVQIFLIVLSVALLSLATIMGERARVEEALRYNQEQLQLALSAGQLGTWDWRVGEDRLQLSPESRRMFGLPGAGDLSLQQLEDTLHVEDRAAVRDALQRALSTGDGFELEFRVERQGQPRWLLTKGEVLESGGARRILGVNVDITVQRRAQLELEAQRLRLTQLARAAALGELSGAVAHELNQPLTAILSNAQAAQRLLAGTHPDHRLVAILDDIVAADKRAADIIRGLRALLTHGEVQFQRLGINDVVREGMLLARAVLTAQGVTARSSLCAEAPAVKGDRTQLQQLLINLITNACEAMAAMAPHERNLSLATRVADGFVGVALSDSGPGLPSGAEECLFEPFFTTKLQGLGLGLAISRSIVAAHSGRIWAEDNRGGGATFHVVLPIASPGGQD